MVDITCEILKVCGYEPLGYSDPRQAVAEFAGLDNVVAALTDHSMPAMDGIEVARALLEQRPDLPIVLMSAVSDDRLTPAYREAGFRAVLSKPYTLQRLRECFEKLLAPEDQPHKD